ncbi:MAG: NAD(P)-dependent oxidoreductase [Novosphingobium sp.]|nr:NAD(P)-dependent oxidoreductase [Novosphingobium sp.]
MTIAVTGGTGFVGQMLLDHARAAGHDVRALTRRDQPARASVEWVRGDLHDQKTLRELVHGTEAVIHVAGVVNAPDIAGFEAGNVTGTLNLLEAAVAAGVPRFVNVSSLAARQPGLSQYGASKARAERLVAASGLDWTTVRPPAVYGPRDSEMLDLFRMARWGVVVLPPPGRMSVIHAGDLAALLLALLPSGERVTRATFEPDDGARDGWTNAAFAKAIGMAMGRKQVWTPHLSQGALMGVARLDGALRRDKAKLTADRVHYMCHPDWVASPRNQVPREIWKPTVRTPEGLGETAAWYRQQGWL